MATPFAHAHVSHVIRKGRRRSQSVTIHKTQPHDTTGLNSQQKQFFAQLQKERQQYLKNNNEQLESVEDDGKESKEHFQPVITRIEEIHPTPSARVITAPARKQLSSMRLAAALPVNDEEHPPTVLRISRTATMKSGQNQFQSERAQSVSANIESPPVSNRSDHFQDDEHHLKYQPQTERAPQVESKMSVKKQMSSTTCKSSNVTVTHTSKTSNLESSQDVSDQNSCPSDDFGRGKVNINGKERGNKFFGQGMMVRSSATCMASTIALVLGTIAFAFGLTSLILVQLLRSTVDNQLALYSTTTAPKYSSGWQTACSSYTTINDPTRSISAPGYPLGCDDTLPFLNQSVGTWIRFTGSGGTQLPLTSPGMNICGSVGTGYYNGVMPSPGELVNGTACFTWTTSVCRFSQMIRVANCDSYYVYFLPPAPACMMRYCTI